MLMALRRAWLLSLAGQTSTQIPQPVQSSAAHCSVYWRPLRSTDLNGSETNVAGAPSRCEASYTFARMAACGQARTHWLHWMQMRGSHTGTSRARLRFSHWLVGP